jgi:hypothetical protein
MKELLKKYPNDQDLGKACRKLFENETSSAVELLKEVIALHGFGGYGYANGLVERGKYYLETEDGKVRKWQNSCDGEMMNVVDDKIIAFLKKNSLK